MKNLFKKSLFLFVIIFIELVSFIIINPNDNELFLFFWLGLFAILFFADLIGIRTDHALCESSQRQGGFVKNRFGDGFETSSKTSSSLGFSSSCCLEFVVLLFVNGIVYTVLF